MISSHKTQGGKDTHNTQQHTQHWRKIKPYQKLEGQLQHESKQDYCGSGSGSAEKYFLILVFFFGF